MEAHEAAMMALLGHQALATALAAGAITEEAIAARQAASKANNGANSSAPMQE